MVPLDLVSWEPLKLREYISPLELKRSFDDLGVDIYLDLWH